MKMLIVAGARPNFMKIAPLIRAIKEHNQKGTETRLDYLLVHTGQHYDVQMSEVFFKDLGIPLPDRNLEVGSSSHAVQTAQTMIGFEKVCLEEQPDWVIVVGDVNPTMACTLVATKLGIRVAHVEAGLRSRDRRMPEEINRIATDVLADLLFTPSPDADQNLLAEGIPADRIRRVGNIMIDSLEMTRERIEAQGTFHTLGLTPGSYGVVTMHRPSNVDQAQALRLTCEALSEAAKAIPLLFPVHPRTRGRLQEHGLLTSLHNTRNLRLLDPLDYLSFMNLVFNSRLVITDSGGIQEETTYLGVPCLTVRENTERPITISHGTNELCELRELRGKVERIMGGPPRRRPSIELWDGRTAERIVQVLKEVAS